jgi:MoxR-like ATPase
MDEQPEREASHVPAAAAAPRAGASSPLIGGGAGRVSGPESIEQLQELLGTQSYLADRGLATAVFLALSLGQPLLLEGEAGVGKTEVAKALAAAYGVELIRLQCYEGIDASQALYEWDYARQLLYARALHERGSAGDDAAEEIFSSRFLIERPLLKALRAGERAVLLIDEIDRADDEFEAFLLEVLSDFQVTIPEIGTIHAEQPPLVVLTSNRTRELHDALRRRCLYHWIDYPDPRREVEIVLARAPEVAGELAARAAASVARLRELDLVKKPGVAETIAWVRALTLLGATTLERDDAAATLGAVIKDHDDQLEVEERLDEILGAAP